MTNSNFNYTQIAFNDGFKINEDSKELLSITRNNDLLVLAVKHSNPAQPGGYRIHVYIYRVDANMPYVHGSIRKRS